MTTTGADATSARTAVRRGAEVDAVRVRRLTRRFGRRTVLDGIDLTVPRGAVVGYLGPNGAGRTTTMRILLGMLRPTDGHALVLGGPPGDPQARARIGYLPGEFRAYLAMTAAAYLSYLASLRPSFDQRAIPRLAERLGLVLDQRIGTLSHGTLQKIGLVQALMHDPDLLVLDEPSSGLDPLVQREFLSLVREARERGAGVLLSSHVMAEVEAVADAVAILKDGRLVVVDDVQHLVSGTSREFELTFAGVVPVPVLRASRGVTDVSVTGRTARVSVAGSTADLLARAAPYAVDQVRCHEPDLTQVFQSFYRPSGGTP